MSLPGASQVCSSNDSVSPVIGQLQKLSSAYDVAMVMTKDEDDRDNQQQQLRTEEDWRHRHSPQSTLSTATPPLLLLLPLTHCYGTPLGGGVV